MKMKKILLITTRDLRNAGGVERYINNFIKYYRRPDTELILLLKRFPGSPELPGADNISIRYFDNKFHPYQNFLRFLNPGLQMWHIRQEIKDHLKTVAPDMILTRDREIALAATGVMKNVPVFFMPGSLIKMDLMLDNTVKGSFAYRISRLIQNGIKVLLEALAFWRSTHILVFSQAFQKRIHNYYKIPLRKIRVFRMGIELPLQDSQVRPEKGMILCVGRLSRSKNFQTAVEAMKGLEGFHLYIAGEGPHRPEIENLIRELRLENAVTLLGEQDDLKEYYQRCEIFLHPSYYENLGQVLLEAMSYGKAPIVLDINQPGVHTASAELIQDRYNGFFVANNPQAIRAKILEVSQLPQDVLAANCKAFAQQFSFSWPYFTPMIPASHNNDAKTFPYNDCNEKNSYLIFTPMALARKEVLTRLGLFNDTLHITEDYDLWLRMIGTHI